MPVLAIPDLDCKAGMAAVLPDPVESITAAIKFGRTQPRRDFDERDQPALPDG